MSYTAEQRTTLSQLSRSAIWSEFHPEEVRSPQREEAWLNEPRACFVTLKKFGELRGCIGSLKAHRPLLEEIWESARAAAFHDPRFPPLNEDEFAQVEVELSVLTPLQPIHPRSEEALLAQLRPGIDGLVMKEGVHKATFLPAVWAQLPVAAEFLEQLRRKAGLPLGYWSDALEFFIYQTEKWSEEDNELD
ncbi:AmmeMemoRadiSam system protein A [Neptuniibacter halophilus]|uniref:AmmeMemoRadiSam system protein A n=1 Tax=Neptuniibacter halophilus TaxID=651666 RepID=UPI0025726237|nr:AmmeMemoRadiSam system protein A [Neptuniibacter halophilus]